jgi:glycosyltransferase involved in cell wall biosynthesis
MRESLDPIRKIIVYRDTLFTPSETFIRSQGEALRHFRPIYVCLRRTGCLVPSTIHAHRLCRSGVVGRLQRVRFKLLGPSVRQCAALSVYNPALLHAHFAPDASESMRLAQFLKIPLLVSLHGYDVNSTDDELPRRYLHRLERLKAASARFICISEFIRQQALKKGFPAEKLVVHYIGIDTSYFSPDPLIERRPFVLFVGRLVPNKACEYLIRAMSSVQKAMPEARLVLIGDGAERSHLESLSSAIGIDCDFLGAQPHSAVRDWMNRAKVLCVPSIITPTSQEGFGMVFAEAQAMGMPVVSTAIGGIPEAVCHERTGFLVPERDTDALASKLLLLLRNQDLWTNFSEAARIRANKEFNISTQATLLENIYEDVLVEWETQRKLYVEGEKRRSS